VEEREQQKAIILFDGVCNLCSGAVQWIIKHDKKEHFVFASLQSETGKVLQSKYEIPAEEDSVILIQNNKAYLESSAALRIAGHCSGIWKFWYVFLIVPKFIRDAAYRFIARNRYKWFGKKEECWLPDERLKKRFI